MIKHEFYGYNHGQSDERLYTTDDKNEVTAYVDYSVYEGQPAIKMIQSAVPRQGLARSLLLKLQSMFPDVEIDWGMLTDDGAALKRSLTFKEIVDPVMKAKEGLLARVKTKIAHLERSVTPENIKSFSDLWTRLYDMERRLEDELEHAVMSKRLIVG